MNGTSHTKHEVVRALTNVYVGSFTTQRVVLQTVHDAVLDEDQKSTINNRDIYLCSVLKS